MKAAAAMANGAWLAANLPAWHSFRRGLARPGEVQSGMLRRLVKENASSAYGQTHGFGAIANYEQFRARVPMVDHDAMEPWISRIMRGETAVLTREPVTRLVPTSGSSGARKLIPFTLGLQREFNRAIGPWMIDLGRTYSGVHGGPSYWSISPNGVSSTDPASAVPVGFAADSAFLGGARQRLVEATFAVSSALRLSTDIECFRYLTLLSLLRQPEWSFASVWHPSFLTLLLDALPEYWDELLTDIHGGGCRRAAAQAPPVRRAVGTPPQRRRAAALRQIGPEDLSRLWPRLRVVSCWGDGSAGLALAHLQTRLPRPALQIKGLLATEAFVSIPFQGLRPVAINSHFFEFVDDRGTVLLVGELELGRRYTVIVTTGGGLWRYRLGDIVEVDGFVDATPSLRFIGRCGGVSDLCGEKLTDGFVAQALQTACQRVAFYPPFALLAPEISSVKGPRYLLLVEGAHPTELPACLDAALRENPQYDLCRDLGQLGPVSSLELPRGAYDILCRSYLSEGRRLGEIKPQCLYVRTDWPRRFNLDQAASSTPTTR